jgi:hypothetical protein
MSRTDAARLTSGYLDGELSAEDAARLAASFESDEVALERFVLASFIHSQLHDWMGHPNAENEALVGAVAAVGVLSPSNNRPSAAPPQAAAFNARPGLGRARIQSWRTLAAGLLIAASVAVVGYVVASRPTIVGQLTDATNSRWGAPHAAMAVGTLLEAGQELELVEGSAVITFARGAKLLLEGPTKVRLDSMMEVHLADGRIAAKVPRQAIGFTVTSSLARFIDLGTSFTLQLAADKSFELHVFEGLVELQLDERFGKTARQPARVAEVRAVSFDVASGDVANLEFQEGKQMPF